MSRRLFLAVGMGRGGVGPRPADSGRRLVLVEGSGRGLFRAEDSSQELWPNALAWNFVFLGASLGRGKRLWNTICKLTPVGFEPTQLALVELESTPLDHSGKVS